jgi:dTMP kinase
VKEKQGVPSVIGWAISGAALPKPFHKILEELPAQRIIVSADCEDSGVEVRGKFIVIEGPDGCGKSTQAKLLAEALKKRGLAVLLCREPGGTEIGEKIRSVLSDDQNRKMTVETELLLYMASRAQLVEERIKPALDAGKTVVCDRFLLSSVVYQGIVGGFTEENVSTVGRCVTGGLEPDKTIVLDLPVRETFKRLGISAKNQSYLFSQSPDREERKGKKFHEEVYNAYKSLAKSGKGSIVLVNGRGTAEEVHRRVMEAVQNVI